jgi:hypothetical protein
VTLWVDADACPKPAKELIYRTAVRLRITTVLVANTRQHIPASPYIGLTVVAEGFDHADDHIAAHCKLGDLVITADIPLADRVITQGATVIDPRGQILHEENIKAKLALRNLMADLRDQGMVGGGPPPYTAKDKSKFASALHATIVQLNKPTNQ